MSVIINDLLSISTKKLREWNYFDHDRSSSGVISWSINETNTASIGIEVDMDKTVIYLKYNHNDTPVEQTIPLESLNSNIGNGKIWYFNCPIKEKRCSKLFLFNGKFVSRYAIKNVIYDVQCKSKGWRDVSRFFSLSDQRTKLLQDLDEPYHKTHYKGDWTKKSKQLIKLSRQLERLGPVALNALS